MTRQADKTLMVIIVAYAIIVSVINPNFLSLGTLADLTRNGTGMAILAAGVYVIMIAGGIDVSFPAVAIMSGYTSVVIAVRTGIDSMLFIVVVAALIGALLGTVNALLIHWLELPTFIVTLGTSSIFYGLMTTLVGTKPVTISQMPKSMLSFGRWNVISFTVKGHCGLLPHRGDRIRGSVVRDESHHTGTQCLCNWQFRGICKASGIIAIAHQVVHISAHGCAGCADGYHLVFEPQVC